MSALNPENLDASTLIGRALPAHLQAEAGIKRLLDDLKSPIAGRSIVLPGKGGTQTMGPSPLDVMVTLVQSQAVLFQSVRLLMLALESIAQPAPDASAAIAAAPQPANGGQPSKAGEA